MKRTHTHGNGFVLFGHCYYVFQVARTHEVLLSVLNSHALTHIQTHTRLALKGHSLTVCLNLLMCVLSLIEPPHQLVSVSPARQPDSLWPQTEGGMSGRGLTDSGGAGWMSVWFWDKNPLTLQSTTLLNSDLSHFQIFIIVFLNIQYKRSRWQIKTLHSNDSHSLWFLPENLTKAPQQISW